MKSSYINLEELAKKYGYANKNKILDYIRFYKNEDAILKYITTGGAVSYKKALKILRELKQRKNGMVEGNRIDA